MDVETDELVACLLTRSCLASKPRLILADGSVQVSIVLVLLVFETVEVTEINDVIAFFAATVTVGPAGTVA